MSEHPIDGMLNSAMGNIKSMIDVNTVVGNPTTLPDGTVVIPISKVSFGFAAGGSEFKGVNNKDKPNDRALFGGGCGGGANLKPVAFLVSGSTGVRLIPVDAAESPVSKIADLIPEIFEKTNCIINNLSDKISKKKAEKSNDDENINVETTD